jgi:hypothetical protein
MEGRIFMNCSEIEPLIYLVRSGELTEQERILVSQHLTGCEHCSQLSESVKTMTVNAGRLTYVNNLIDTDEQLTEAVRKAIEKTDNPSILPVIKRIAAAILFILTSVFFFQEYSFYLHRKTLQVQLQQSSELKRAIAGESDCVERLQRKIRTAAIASFSVRESRLYKHVTEEELTQFIRQMCESGGADAGTLRKLLLQAGLIDLSEKNKQNN